MWRLPACLLACLPLASPVGAQLPGADEAAKQFAIYQSRGEQRPQGYVVDRTLAAYLETLPSAFARSLSGLGPQERWLDIGSGEGQALLDYHSPRYGASPAHGPLPLARRGAAVAMSIEDRRTPQWHQALKALPPGKLRYLFGRALRDYSAAELGRFELITDLLGAASYTPELDRYLDVALQSLATGGNLYIVLQDVHAEATDNAPFYKGFPYTTEIAREDGSEVKVCSYFRSVSCIEVSCEFKRGWTPPIEAYQLHKTCDAIHVPRLSNVSFSAGTPPDRRFRLIESRATRESAQR